MKIKPIQTIKAPEPIGPYSQAVEVNGFIYTSGQIAVNPESGQIIQSGVEEQTRIVLENLKAILESAGSGLDKVIKTTIYLKNMEDFPVVNTAYSVYFTKMLPARSTVEVSRLPKDVLVEIDCVAVK
ncbi:MAG: RidA family protein [Calditrichaceae bacterium]|jgi:2-iminobutanoate/2-iminopropanoate deaminase